MTDWIDHVKSYAKKHDVSYKEALSKAGASYKKKPKQKGKGVSPVSAVAGAVGEVSKLGSEVAADVHDRRIRSGFYDREGFKQSLALYKHLQWQVHRALLPINQLRPKSRYTDARLKKMSGLDKYE